MDGPSPPLLWSPNSAPMWSWPHIYPQSWSSTHGWSQPHICRVVLVLCPLTVLTLHPLVVPAQHLLGVLALQPLVLPAQHFLRVLAFQPLMVLVTHIYLWPCPHPRVAPTPTPGCPSPIPTDSRAHSWCPHPYLDLRDVLHQLSGDVLAATLQGIRGHLSI